MNAAVDSRRPLHPKRLVIVGGSKVSQYGLSMGTTFVYAEVKTIMRGKAMTLVIMLSTSGFAGTIQKQESVSDAERQDVLTMRTFQVSTFGILTTTWNCAGRVIASSTRENEMADEKKPKIMGGKPATKQGVTIVTSRGTSGSENDNSGTKIVSKANPK